MRSQVQVWALMAIVIVALVGVSCLFFEIAKVQSFVTVVAILAGALFAIFKFQLFRDSEPHLAISQEVSHRVISDKYVHIAVTSTLRNSSKVRVEVRKALFQLQQVVPVSDAEVERLRDQVFQQQEVEDLQWPTCYERNRTWKKNQFIVEPGEAVQVPCEFVISSTVKTVLVYTYIHNSRYNKGPQAVEGWPGSTVYDLADR